ncbi:NAD-dependent epimerase/dehydratase family protein [Micromonospora chalcea]|uniref:NAD-dependent epimerase/dehydratase family protein n=1 Tax=Micromonospora sp. TSRI0369 TaxID=1703936 RepID=UPI000AC8585B|nr:NAD-dependent epimerase/dehydratase family protein [Micromonospora sp. TSRI0369]
MKPVPEASPQIIGAAEARTGTECPEPRAEGGRYLVTGGLGFVGSHLVRHLLALGVQVTVLDSDRTSTRADRLRAGVPAGSVARLRIVAGDVRRPEDLHDALADGPFRAVFHLAAYSVIERAAQDPTGAIATNAIGTVNLLDALRRAPSALPDAVVIASTDKVYGEMEGSRYTEQSALRGIGIYDAAKLAGDVMGQAFHQSFGVPTVVLRLCNVFGPDDRNSRYRLVPRSLSLIFDPAGPLPPELYFESIGHWRDYIYVDDVVTALLLAAGHPACRGEVFNVAGCVNLSTPEVLRRVVEAAAEYERRLDPERAERIMANGFRVVVRGQTPGVTTISRQHLDGTKFAQTTSFRARTDFDHGLRVTVRAARAGYLDPTADPVLAGTTR